MTGPIINCHTHLFTIDDVPEAFLPLGLPRAMRWKPFRKLITWMLSRVIPWSDHDLVERYAHFLRVTYESPDRAFADLKGRYPAGTRFVVLPMDMAYMGRGKVPENLEAQHRKLATLAQGSKDLIIPFAAVDPRRPDVLKHLKTWVEELGVKGIKIYPNLGYFPHDPILMEAYAYLESVGAKAVIAHCSRGGVHKKGLNASQAAKFADPDHYPDILERFPDLNFSLGHFGGAQDWIAYLKDPWNSADPPPAAERSWLSKIVDLLRSGKHPNLYTDISYTVFKMQHLDSLLKVMLSDPRIAEKVLFGSDFYMIEQEEMSERQMVITLRALLGEPLFWQIASENPMRFLR